MSEQEVFQACDKCGRGMKMRQVKDPRAWYDNIPNGRFLPYMMAFVCDHCQRWKQIMETQSKPKPRLVKETCESCDGSGMVECHDCDGEGEIEKWETED